MIDIENRKQIKMRSQKNYYQDLIFLKHKRKMSRSPRNRDFIKHRLFKPFKIRQMILL